MELRLPHRMPALENGRAAAVAAAVNTNSQNTTTCVYTAKRQMIHMLFSNGKHVLSCLLYSAFLILLNAWEGYR